MNDQFLRSIREIILRDVQALIGEIESCEEYKLWSTLPGVTNSCATLALHLCGNLRHFIGSVLANDGYQREREAEFAVTGQSKREIIHIIRITMIALDQAFDEVKPEKLLEEMPQSPPHHKGKSKAFFLMQLSCHLSRHTGQLNYLRRILNA
jgi:hypothetical protein